MKHEASSNGKWSGASNSHEHVGFSPLSPKSPDYEEEEEEDVDDDDVEEDDTSELMDRRCQKIISLYIGVDVQFQC